ncbi:MAG: S8 family serine peptidase [Bacteroidetes bacterium]|nr:S8 family serine peptidase [Bacteroidota bacterium]
MSENLGRIARISALVLFFVLLYFIVRNCNQPDVFYEPFDGPGLPAAWDLSHGDTPGDWTWTADGTASAGNFGAIARPFNLKAGGGAAVFNSDSLAAGALPQHSGQLISPVLRMATRHDNLYLSFHLYYRKHQGQASVWVYGDTDQDQRADTWIDITDSPLVGYDLATAFAEQETRSDARFTYNITPYAAGVSGVQVRFNFEGPLYFWIIDDVRVGPDFTMPGGFEVPTTAAPTTMEEVLKAKGLPVEADGQGGFYNPEQVVVYWDLFNPDGSFISSDQKDSLRSDYGVSNIDTCACDTRLELWTIGPVDPNLPGPSIDGDTIGIQGLKDGESSKSKTMGVDYNYYVAAKPDLQPPTANPNTNPLSLAPGIPEYSDDPVVIAILDTGIDYDEVDLQRNIWRSNDQSCAGPGDVIGWDFISNHRNPADNHPDNHGTNVARVVLRELLFAGVDHRLMPVKTHDGDGLSNLFHTTCGTFYAIAQGVDVINQSWGWYGAPNEVMQIALEQAEANNITVTTVAGNNGLGINADTLIYPACYDGDSLPNVLAAASVWFDDDSGEVIFSDFSNYSAEYIDLAAPGQGVYVLGTSMPMDDTLFVQLQEKDDNVTGVTSLINGTSFSAPYLAAMAARARAAGAAKPWEEIINAGKSASTNIPVPELAGKVKSGAYLHPKTPFPF